MDAEAGYQRLIWIALTVLVVAIAAYVGVVITQQSIEDPAAVEQKDGAP